MSKRPNRRTLVINEPTRVQRRRNSFPLIPITTNDFNDSSFAGETSLKIAPGLLLPPNTMEVIINESRRRAEQERAKR